MTGIKDYSTTAASNTAYFPENMNPSDVNDYMRQVQADLREWYETPQWRDWGDTVTYASSTTFTISGDVTARYIVGQRLKLYGTTMGTFYGTISGSSYSSPNTTVTVTLDSGSLTSNLSRVFLGVDPTNDPIPFTALSGTIAAAQIAASSITKAKIENLTNYTVLGNVSGGAAAPAEVTILDEDTMSTDSATALATQQSIKAYVDSATASPALPLGYLSGLQLSNNGTDSDHDIDIAAGECRDAANGANITLSAITKRIDATWSSGTGNGGLSSSLTAPANSTWYHVFAIIVSGSADVGFDTSITAANLVSDHSATSYRRLGSVLTDGSANILAFIQSGDIFYWGDPPLSYSSSITAGTGATVTLGAPTGVRCMVGINGRNATGSAWYVRPSDVNDETISTTAAPLASASDGANASGGFVEVLSNTSAQIHADVGSTGNMYITTLYWKDSRGK